MRKYIIKNKEYIFLCMMILFTFPVILLGTGTITSGWHLVDDHEIIRLVDSEMNGGVSFCDALRKDLNYDLTIRWRPLYRLIRVAMAYLFGANSLVYNVLLCMIGMGTYTLLYLTARNVSYNILQAHLFSLLVLIGRQYEVWYRVANQENIGLFLFAICLYIISMEWKAGFYNCKKYDVFLVVFSIADSMMKESFLILLPGIVLLRIGLECIYEKLPFRQWWHIVRKHIVLCGVTSTAFLISAYIIFRYVGTNSIGYAGIDPNGGLFAVIWGMMRMCKDSIVAYAILAVILIIVLGVSWKKDGIEKQSGYFWIWCAFGVYVALFEMVLYAKSGMWNRYVIPFSVGYGIVFIGLMPQLLKEKFLKILYWCILIIFLITRFKVAIFDFARNYSNNGVATQNMLDYVVSNTDEDACIVSALIDSERDGAICVFFGHDNRKNVRTYMEDTNMSNNEYDCGQKIEIEQDWDVLILDSRKQYCIKGETGLDTDEWHQEEIGDTFTVWMKIK